MSNLHAPTVPSGPTTSAPTTNGRAVNLTMAELQRKKDNLEAELKALGSVLDSHHVTMDTSLLTPDGFPRADIDVAQIRTTRARIIHLRNDYKDLMLVIEKQLHEHFASLAANAADENSAAEGTGDRRPEQPLQDSVPEALDPPFARVDSVADGGPADQAGVKVGDQLRGFGYVNYVNHDGLKRLAECVQGNEGQPVLVKVSRPSPGSQQPQELRLTLTPRRNWGGRGLLGFHILPI